MCAVSLHKQCLVNMQIYIVVIFQIGPPIKLLRNLAILCRPLELKGLRYYMTLVVFTLHYFQSKEKYQHKSQLLLNYP